MMHVPQIDKFAFVCKGKFYSVLINFLAVATNLKEQVASFGSKKNALSWLRK